VSVGDGISVGISVAEADGVSVAVGVSEGVKVAVAVSVGVAVGVGVSVGVLDGVKVAVGVSVGVGVGVSLGIERVGTIGPRRVGWVFADEVQPAKISARHETHNKSQKRTTPPSADETSFRVPSAEC
jgi:hypothetical protein